MGAKRFRTERLESRRSPYPHLPLDAAALSYAVSARNPPWLQMGTDYKQRKAQGLHVSRVSWWNWLSL